jgi:predicted DCC family thiol-disulfide oxidoreductase YuxK
MQVQNQSPALLLYNDECSVCRRIARWVQKSAQLIQGEASLVIERPIGNDPEALRSLNPALDIWDAYATIHLLMPDGSMKLGGEAVAEVFRRLPNTRWFASLFSLRLFGFRPFQGILNLSYTLLADVRPLFGCESCGIPKAWMKPIGWTIKRVKGLFGAPGHRNPHFASLPLGARQKASPGGA